MSEKRSNKILWLELWAVVAIYAVPILFASIVSAHCLDYLPSNPTGDAQTYQVYGSDHISVWVLFWSFVHRFTITYGNDIDGLSTLVIAAFTVILAWSTVRLWKETERLAALAEEQSKDTKDVIRATQRQAAAAEAQVRPFVRISQCALKFNGPNAFAAFKFVVENTSENVARSFRWGATVRYWNPTTKDEKHALVRDWMNGEVVGPIVKGIPTTVEFGVPEMPLSEFVGPNIDAKLNLLVTVKFRFTYSTPLPSNVEDSAFFSGIAFQRSDKQGDALDRMNVWVGELLPTLDDGELRAAIDADKQRENGSDQ